MRQTPPPGTKQKLDELGAERFAQWMLAQQRVLMTDTTMRDAHQSLLATRMRQRDMSAIAPYYAHMLPQLFSVECWGGATFDVAMRFLREGPVGAARADSAQRMPNLLLQMLLRSANAVGYTNYPDNVVRAFVKQAATPGVDVFRVFDSLNWVENMRVAIDAVLETGKLCEAAICYTGNLSSAPRTKYTLDYYLEMGRELESRGHAHPRHQGHGRAVPAESRIHAGQGAQGGDRDPRALPHARHARHRGGERAGGDRRPASTRWMAPRCHERPHVAAQPRLDRRGAAVRPARHRHRPGAVRAISMYWEQVRKNYLRVRERHPRRRVRGVRARHARRAVHEPQGAGALGGP